MECDSVSAPSPLWPGVTARDPLLGTDQSLACGTLRVPIPHRLRGMLEAESGLNDAPTVLLVTLASALAAGKPAEETYGAQSQGWV